MRSSIALVAAAALVASLSAPAEAYVVQWRDSTDLTGAGQLLAVDQSDGDVLAMTSLAEGSQVVRRLNGSTGAVEWTTEVAGDPTHIVVDPTDGRVVVAGAYKGPMRLTVLDRDGQVLKDADTGIQLTSVVDLELDPETGRACALGSRGRRSADKLWVTSCWDRSGELLFSRTWDPPGRVAIANQLVIDPVRNRVYVAGTSQRVVRNDHQDLVVLAYDVRGKLRWKRQKSGALYPSFLEVALDAARGRIHVLARPGSIQRPMKLFSFDTRGRLTFVRSWRDVVTVYESAVAVTPKGDVVAAAADGDRMSMRTYRPSGRLRTAKVVRIADKGDDGGLPKIAIDTARGRVHVVNDRENSDGAVLFSFTAAGKRMSSVLVDTAKNVFAISIVVHDASGAVITSTNPWPEGPDQVVSVLP